jgi:hypothetical protein
MLDGEQASAVARGLPAKLLSSPEMEGLHATEAGDGSRQICLPSVLKLIGRLSGARGQTE